jgi:hypothetical protein
MGLESGSKLNTTRFKSRMQEIIATHGSYEACTNLLSHFNTFKSPSIYPKEAL